MPLLPRDVGGGSGGGIEEAPLDGKLYGRRMARWDPVPTLLTLIYYRGPFATPDELKAAHPTDMPGAYAVVSSTSSIWIWNHDKWEDTGATQTQAGILDAPHDGKTYGRKDGDWVVVGTGTINEEEVILLIKKTPHNDLKGIQGGKVEGGKVTEAYHLTKDQWEGLPVRPSIVSPANNATDINQVPQFAGSPYAHPQDTLMYMKHIQLAKTNDFAAPVYDKEEVSRNVTFQVPLKPDNFPYLEQDTAYYARIRYRDRRMRWSHWSAPIRFVTMKTFPINVLVMPEMIIPADGGEASAYNPLLAMTTPKVVGGVAEFDKADWQISTDSTFATTLYDAPGTDDLVTHIAKDLNLTVVQASDFYARGRQRLKDGTYTPWARPVRFGLRPEFDDPVFGLRRVFSKKYGVPMLFNIDEDGDVVYIPKRYWDRHPLYLFARQDINFGEGIGSDAGTNFIGEMIYVPPCWIKHRVYDNGDGDMVIDLWFSANERSGDGWMLHPAFARSRNGFLHGVHPARVMATKKSGGEYFYMSTPRTSGYFNDAPQEPMDVLNQIVEGGSNSAPWHFVSIYEYMLLADLITAEFLSLRPLLVGTTFNWRGFRRLVDEYYYVVYSGIALQDTESKRMGVRFSPPQGGQGFYEIPLNLTLEDTGNATEIVRGHHAGLGFDLALLGIVSAVGSEPSPFGLNNIKNAKRSRPIPPNTSALNAYYKGLFGITHNNGSNGGTADVRVCKGLD